MEGWRAVGEGVRFRAGDRRAIAHMVEVAARLAGSDGGEARTCGAQAGGDCKDDEALAADVRRDGCGEKRVDRDSAAIDDLRPRAARFRRRDARPGPRRARASATMIPTAVRIFVCTERQ